MSDVTVGPIILNVTHEYGASAERVFDAWLDPEKAGKFLFATPDGVMQRVEIDPRVGGTFNITERRGDQDAEHTGEYLEIERPRRLVFSFAESLVTVEISPNDNGCTLSLRHEIDPKYADYLDRTREGWTMILDGLERALVN